MNAAKHTPGPWHQGVVGGDRHVMTKSGYVIASINRGNAYKDGHEANANLIAAAPDLVETLKDFLFDFGNFDSEEDVMSAFKAARRAARAVLAKAGAV